MAQCLNWPNFTYDLAVINCSNCFNMSAALSSCAAAPLNPVLLAPALTETAPLLYLRNSSWADFLLPFYLQTCFC